MNKKTIEITILMLLLTLIIFCVVMLVTTGNDSSYVLTCDNAGTLEAYKSCMYLNSKIN